MNAPVTTKQRLVPDYVVTTCADPKVGHLTVSVMRDEATIDWEKLRLSFPHAVLWERAVDGTMTPIAGV